MASYNTADPGVAPYPVAGGQNPQAARNARSIDPTQVFAEANARRASFGQRVRSAFAYIISGADAPLAFFGPMQPLQPQAQPPERGAVGRQFDYPVGFNTRIVPRHEEPIGFTTLRNLADGYDLMRLVLETRKDQLVEAKWSFGPEDEKNLKRVGRADPPGSRDLEQRCDVLRKFWKQPDREHTWQEWLRMVLEQLFVFDAPALHPVMTRGGELYALQILDGATITRKLALDGRTPSYADGPAYQQILKGLPAVDYTTLVPRGEAGLVDPETGFPMPELLYKPRNLRVDRVYGFGPVEQVITTVNIALRRQLHQLTYYTDGATPDLLMRVPPEWNTDQIAKFQTFWDSMLSGNSPNRRKGLFIPGGVEPFDTKDAALKDEMDDWLARIICFAFSISPTPFIKQMNRATAETQQQQSTTEGLKPIQRWITDLVDAITRAKFGWTDITLRWDEEEALSPTEQADIDVKLVKGKILHPDEARMSRGLDPMPAELRAQMDLATFNEAINSVVLPDEQQQAQNDHALAMQAAKPAPVVGPSAAQQKADKVELAALLKSMQPPAPSITVEAPQITLPAAPAISVDARTTIEKGAIDAHVEPITVHTPEVKQGDTFVDVGATNVKVDGPPKPAGIKRDEQGNLRTPDGRAIERSVTYARDERGELVGKITDSTTRTVRAERGADGKLLAKVES